MTIRTIEVVRVICGFICILTPGFLVASIMGLSVAIGHSGPKAPLVFIPVAFFITMMAYPAIYLVCSLFAHVMSTIQWMKTAFAIQLAPIAIPVFLFLLMVLLPGRLFVDPPLDVTQDQKYEFKDFQGTVWRTKVKVALADITRRQDRTQITMLPPCFFDRTHPGFISLHYLTIVQELPIGTKIRINRLMETFGNAGGVYVEATINDETAAKLNKEFINKNKFIYWYSNERDVSNNWGVNTEMLEKVE